MAKGMPGMETEPELVSREVQASFGLFTGVVVYSAEPNNAAKPDLPQVGALSARVSAFLERRLGHLASDDQETDGYFCNYLITRPTTNSAVVSASRASSDLRSTGPLGKSESIRPA